MNDLISRKALLEAYDKAHKGPPGGARKLIEEAPEAVVRCEHCKFNIGGRCDNLDLWVETVPEWFCADGKKKGATNE